MTTPNADPPPRDKRALPLCLLLALLVFAAFGPALGNDFVKFDDNLYVTANDHVQNGLTLDGILWACGNAVVCGNWHPVTLWSHMFDCQLFGLKPGGHHLTSLLFHVANTILLFLVLRRMTSSKSEVRSPKSEVADEGQAQAKAPSPLRSAGAVQNAKSEVRSPKSEGNDTTSRCAFVAAIFAVHPLRVESVAWISERKDVLSAFFFFLTLWAYGRYAETRNPKPESRKPTANTEIGREKAQEAQKKSSSNFLRLLRLFAAEPSSSPAAATPVRAASFGPRASFGLRISAFGSRIWYCTALLFFALGLMSKPMLVTVPFVLLLLNYWPLGRFGVRSWKLKVESSKFLASSPKVQGSKFDVQGSTVSPTRSPLPPPSLHQSITPPLRLFFEKLPFFLLSAVSCVVTFLAQQGGGAVTAMARLPLAARAGNAVVSYCRYLGKLFWPTDLAVLYPLPGHWPPATVLLAALAVLAVTAAALYWGLRGTAIDLRNLRTKGLLSPALSSAGGEGEDVAARPKSMAVGDRGEETSARESSEPVAQPLSPALAPLVPRGAREGTLLANHSATPAPLVPRETREGTLASNQLKCEGARGQYPYLAVGWLWYVVMMVPVIGLVQVGEQAMADRYTYLPLIGILIAVTWAVADWIGKAESRKQKAETGKRVEDRSPKSEVRSPKLTTDYTDYTDKKKRKTRNFFFFFPSVKSVKSVVKTPSSPEGEGSGLKAGISQSSILSPQSSILVFLSVAAVIVCVGLTRQQVRYWKNTETLFRRALAVTENNYVAHNNFGTVLLEQGRNGEAMGQYREALRLRGDYPDARNNLGLVFLKQGQTDEAIRQFQETIRLTPGYSHAHNGLGLALAKQGQTGEAIREYQEAIRLSPGYDEAYCNLGAALLEAGQVDEAIRQLQAAIHFRPNYAEAHYALGTALGKRGQIDAAAGQFQDAIRLKPDYADAHSNLGNVLAMKGRLDEAIREYQEAIRLKPDQADAHNNLGLALGMKGRTEEAIREYQEATG